MRLWAEQLIPFLPDAQLLGQHREICALRGLGWGKKHSTVDYVFASIPQWLYCYHMKVIKEMWNRGFNVDECWDGSPMYRGKNCEPHNFESFHGLPEDWEEFNSETACKTIYDNPIYPEHNDDYLQECLSNLWGKYQTKIIPEGNLKKIKQFQSMFEHFNYKEES